MFPYYGRKERIIGLYPEPLHDVIVEPFAGSATYSVHHADHDVILTDLDSKIVTAWRYIIDASPSDILSLPLFAQGYDLRDSCLTDEERCIVGLFINGTNNGPRNIVQNRSKNKWTVATRASLADFSATVKHWRIARQSWRNLPNLRATWFIDPPYKGRAGDWYRHGSSAIDYSALGGWCRRRGGQVIACESDGLWLPFKPLTQHRGMTGINTREVIYLQQDGRPVYE